MKNAFRGITCAEEARIRCRVNDAGCWLWIGFASHNGGTPQAWFPTLGVSTSIRAGLWRLENGDKPFPRNRAMVPMCGEENCINPAHSHMRTRSYVAKTAPPLPPTHRYRVQQAMRSMSKLTEADIIRIRTGHEPTDKLAADLGVTRKHVRDIRSGRSWKENVVPSSVFALA